MTELKGKYNLIIHVYTMDDYFERLKNQIFKLLPLREEGKKWEKFLETLLIELGGLDSIFRNQVNFIVVIGKLEGLLSLNDFKIYRKTIFEIINLIDSFKTKENE